MVVLLNGDRAANRDQVARDLPLNVELLVANGLRRLRILLPHGAVAQARGVRGVVEGAVVHLNAEEGPPDRGVREHLLPKVVGKGLDRLIVCGEWLRHDWTPPGRAGTLAHSAVSVALRIRCPAAPRGRRPPLPSRAR